ncbi:hypothetical protein COJ79_31040 [Bacillus thuringiensis]|uniref:DUF4304 domain-containing protein n=1 Tax=Bacillus TaxID=1386 RepID=UPI000BF58D3B|nr:MULTISPECIES: hypothetical protein [Bacillus cereus group]MCC2543627.1 DUF4304 domain-containing protein [Bacillus thuringiensis]MDF9543912.1 hypothetical protein [Bacillus cereus]PFO05996.1 hypothetical protein COJ79_31040 [Bacillus thuringiensis]RHW09671.1 hypothetical protein B7P27_05100 [Bacillus cereus]HDR4456117.1 hypothetical protein [Bacillus cereus]
MNKKELKLKLLQGLGEALKENGYKTRTTQQDLVKKFDKGKISIHLAFINHPEDFHVTVDVGIRFDELENMKNQWDEGLTIKEKKETYTIGVELGNLVHREQKRWRVEKEEDILPVTMDILKEVKEYFIPYIDKYVDVENVFDLCVRDDDEARAKNAIGLALLLNKEEMLEQIIEKKKEYLKTRDKFELELFENFLSNMNLG